VLFKTNKVLFHSKLQLYLKLKEEALDRTVWRTRFGRGYGTVVRDSGMNECLVDEYGADEHICA
jgi:hypothetical protein